jgi:hypothetical protein
MKIARLPALWVAALSVAGLAGISAPDLSAQQRDSLQARLILPTMPMYQPEAPPAPPPVRTVSIFPGITVASPNALGADGGTVYAGAGFQERTRFLKRSDGAVFAGIGLFEAHEYVGLELMVVSYSTVRSGLFDRAGLSAQVHRYLTDNTAVALGVENFVLINGDESDTGRSFYGVATHIIPLRPDPAEPFSMVTATLGVGNGRFRTEDDVLADRSTVGVFGGVSLHVIRPLALLADWTGQDLALGVSLVPFARIPLVIAPALVDVTHTAGDGARFVLAVGLGQRLTKGSIQF